MESQLGAAGVDVGEKIDVVDEDIAKAVEQTGGSPNAETPKQSIDKEESSSDEKSEILN